LALKSFQKNRRGTWSASALAKSIETEAGRSHEVIRKDSGIKEFSANIKKQQKAIKD